MQEVSFVRKGEEQQDRAVFGMGCIFYICAYSASPRVTKAHPEDAKDVWSQMLFCSDAFKGPVEHCVSRDCYGSVGSNLYRYILWRLNYLPFQFFFYVSLCRCPKSVFQLPSPI